MPKHGKKYRELKKRVPEKEVSLEEAVALVKDLSSTKFVPSCEMHARLGIDPKQADQSIRTSVSLPHGTGKEIKVIAFCDDDKVDAAKKAGAVEAGTEKLVEKIKGGWLDFDTAVAEPSAMKALGKIAKILGQKGLMPNPKSGTVGPDVAKMVEEIKKGKVEIRNDKTGNVHTVFGKANFPEEKLTENAKAILKALLDVKPNSLKGVYIKSLTVSTSMSPSIKVDPNSVN